MYQANWKLEENTFYYRDFSKMFWLDFPESVAYVSFSKAAAAGRDCSKAVCTKC